VCSFCHLKGTFTNVFTINCQSTKLLKFPLQKCCYATTVNKATSVHVNVVAAITGVVCVMQSPGPLVIKTTRTRILCAGFDLLMYSV